MVTKEEGKPYKGTVYRSETKQPWDAGWWGKGTYFSDTKSYARQYGKPQEYSIELKNPYYSKGGKDLDNISLEIWDDLKQKGLSSEERQEEMAKYLRNKLESMGYDGVVVQRGPFKEVVAFHPENQIKPVIPGEEGKVEILENTRKEFKNLRSKFSQKQGGLEKKLFFIITIGIFTISIFFLSPNLTGNTIANLTNQTSNIIGGALFVIGIFVGYSWIKK